MDKIFDKFTVWRVKLAVLVFVATLVWPLVHMYVIRAYDISPWRLFGWGMYSTPHALRFSSIRFVFVADPSQTVLAQVLPELTDKPLIGSQPDAQLMEAYILSGDKVLHVPLNPREARGTGEDRDDHKHILEFSSQHAIKRAHARIRSQIPARLSSTAFIVVSRQRLNLAGKKLYTTNKIYYVDGEELRYLGTTPLYNDTFGQLMLKLQSKVSAAQAHS